MGSNPKGEGLDKKKYVYSHGATSARGSSTCTYTYIIVPTLTNYRYWTLQAKLAFYPGQALPPKADGGLLQTSEK